ncbi:SLC13 family permease [Gammaproteobacteria bacterium AS21]
MSETKSSDLPAADDDSLLAEQKNLEKTTPTTFNKEVIKKIISGVFFVVLSLAISFIVPSVQIAWVVSVLLITIYLFAFEVVRIDIAAICVMVFLGLTSMLAPLLGLEEGLVDPQHLFVGFSSNAVISIIAVMIIGAGLDKTGLMGSVAQAILKLGGKSEKRIIPIISGAVGVISSFMQNVGAAALFIPVVSRISARANLPMSRLLMPMGFCAILGGTMTMIGSSPLILLNDLISASNLTLPADKQMQMWGLFSVTPVGICLIAVGIAYFVVLGRYVLPKHEEQESESTSPMAYFKETYGLDYGLIEVLVPSDSDLVGMTLQSMESPNGVRVIAAQFPNGSLRIGPGGLDRNVGIESNTVLGVMGTPSQLSQFYTKFALQLRPEMNSFSDALSSQKAGIAEVVVPPGSNLIGKSAIEIRLRNSTGMSLMGLHRAGETIQAGDNVRAIEFQAGDTLICHTTWQALSRLEGNRNYIVVNKDYPIEELRPHKVGWALTFFTIAISMVLFTDIRLSIALLTGALGMVMTNVISIDEAYKAVSWKTVFLLASLIPLGMAVESSGTAAWIASNTLILLDGVPIWGLQLAVAILATFFSLVMSNVGATVLLVPLAINIALGAGGNPAVFALIVALATSNAFIIPTHQVNALIMGPGGYKVVDFLRAGGIMSILFLVVLIAVINLFY